MEGSGDFARAKTVVHLVPAMEQGGVERVVCDLNRALVRAGWRSVVVSRGGRLVRQIVADGGEHVALDLKSKNPLTYLTRAWKLRKTIQKIAGGDSKILVCAHSRVPAWLYVGARLKFPWITYAHGANSVSRYSAVMTKGDRVVVPSKFLAGYLLENYGGAGGEGAGDGAPASKTGTRQPVGRVAPRPPRNAALPLRDRIRVICPAVDFGRFDPAKVDAAAVAAKRREWGVRDGERVEMSIGRITALKGFDNVIRDFAANAGEIAERSETAEGRAPAGKTLNGTTGRARRPATAAKKLIIVGGVDKGKEALFESLKQLAAELGVADRVVFAGAQSDIPTCLAVADEVVSGNVAKPESFGLSVAEALAMGKPVRLLRNFGGAGEILEECGLWNAREQDGDAAAGRARRPATAEERREAIRALCDFDIMWRKTEKVYEELLK